ncbi:MAG: hypothetical protein KatS3mg124_0354 [Porticoccaceae bacterium]|nr:MAG: hypothetical protein KatS3mg124_0354 [Porticoccaceae bacterium]
MSAPTALAPLLAALEDRYGAALQGALLYGSCLRSGDFRDGLVDLWVVVDQYSHAYGRRIAALANRLLPPNVFYLEVPSPAGPLRAKYGVIALAQLERAVSRRAFESYFWGRLAQPVEILYARTPQLRARLERVLAAARDTFLARALAVAPPAGPLAALWLAGLAASYRSELRAEGPERAAAILAAAPDFFLAATRAFAAGRPDRLELKKGAEGWNYRARLSPAARRWGRLAWRLRRPWGKAKSLARLLKGLFTFEGALDYAAWKLERHSGRRVEIPPAVRRRPLIHGWAFLWRLYREGLFR